MTIKIIDETFSYKPLVIHASKFKFVIKQCTF